MFRWVFLAIRGEQRIPLFLGSGPSFGDLSIRIVSFLGDVEFLVRGEAELGLQRRNIIRFESCETNEGIEDRAKEED